MNRSETRLEVRYAETDQMGVVYYANHLVWMEVGRTDFCRKAGFLYSEMERQNGVMIAVSEARCRYRRPARYGDSILVRTTLTGLTHRTLKFSYAIVNESSGELLAEGTTRHVAVGRDGRPTRMPSPQFELLSKSLSPDPS